MPGWALWLSDTERFAGGNRNILDLAAFTPAEDVHSCESRAKQMPTEAEIYRDLNEIFADVFMRDDITLTACVDRQGGKRLG